MQQPPSSWQYLQEPNANTQRRTTQTTAPTRKRTSRIDTRASSPYTNHFFQHRILLPCFLPPPLLTLLLPLAFHFIGCTSLGCVCGTHNNTLVILPASCLLWWTCRCQISKHAPNVMEARKALSKSWLWLPLLCLVISSFVCRLLIPHNWMSLVGLGKQLGAASLADHLQFGMKAFLTTCLLSFLVMSRYRNVRTCPSLLVTEHPVKRLLRIGWNIVRNGRVLEEFLDWLERITAPPANANRQRQPQNGVSYVDKMTITYNGPSGMTVFKSGVLHTLLGAAYGIGVSLTFSLECRTLLCLAGAVGGILSLTQLSQLDPVSRVVLSSSDIWHDVKRWWELVQPRLIIHLQNLLPLVALFSVIPSGYSSLTNPAAPVLPERVYSFVLETVLSMLLSCAVILQLSFLDYLVELFLTQPNLSLSRIHRSLTSINKHTSNNNKTPDIVMLRAILYHHPILLSTILQPTQPNPVLTGYFDYEGEEVKRNDDAMELFATLFTDADVYTSSFVGGMWRMMLLESIGGGGVGVGDETNTTNERIRKYDTAVQKAVETNANLAVPILRALCASAGGMGEILLRLHEQHLIHQRNQRDSNEVQSFPQQYYLPLTSIQQGMHAITAAAHMVCCGLQTRGRHCRLALLLPVVLHSAYRLKCGAERYPEIIAERKVFAIDKKMSQEEPQSLTWMDLVEACDKAALLVCDTIQRMDTHAEFRLQSGCRDWMQRLLESNVNARAANSQ